MIVSNVSRYARYISTQEAHIFKFIYEMEFSYVLNGMNRVWKLRNKCFGKYPVVYGNLPVVWGLKSAKLESAKFDPRRLDICQSIWFTTLKIHTPLNALIIWLRSISCMKDTHFIDVYTASKGTHVRSWYYHINFVLAKYDNNGMWKSTGF